MKRWIPLVLLAMSAETLPVTAQGQAPAAKPEDVGSIDGLMKALYDVISGPAGQQRDWARMRSLFAPGARMIPTRPPRNAADSGSMTVWSPDDYVTRAGPMLEKDGFFEKEIGRTTDRYGNIAQIFSTYESRRTPAAAKPFMRGINSIQAWNDGKRWWIVSIFWEGESPSNPIPAKYLKSGS
jgi:hypothetical protein